mgnify:CR=1 FL=1
MNKTRDIALLAAGAALAPRTAHHHHRTEVHEHRAPTGESVRLLKEMEEAAREKVLAAIPLENNQIDCKVVFERSFADMTLTATAVFTLNGKRLRAEASVYESATPEAHRDLLKKLHEAIAAEVAAKILGESLRTMTLPF